MNDVTETSGGVADMVEAESFLYFAFGSNLSSQRIRKNSPSAVFVSIARLPGYDLRFCGYAPENWKGATATIWKTEGAEMWGVVWRISSQHADALDRQEGPRYRQVEVEVTTPQGEMMKCRSYHLQNPELSDGPPSPQYLRTVLLGAKENQLPEEYVQRLLQVKDNGYDGEVFIP